MSTNNDNNLTEVLTNSNNNLTEVSTNDDLKLTVMSYNVLAFGATNKNDNFKSGTNEFIEHRDKRHHMIVNKIKNSKCDVIY